MLTILKAYRDLAKSHHWTGRDWQTVPFSEAKTFEAEATDCASISDLYDVLRWLESEPKRCLIHGKLIPGSPAIGPRTLNDKADGTKARFVAPDTAEWLMLDIDHLPCPDDIRGDDDASIIARVEHAVSCLPTEFQTATFVYQLSASAGVKEVEFVKLHLFFWIANPKPLSIIKARAKAEHWPVDGAPFNAIQVHYTAAPIFSGRDDPLAGRRTGLIRRETDTVTLPDWKPAPKPVVPAEQKLAQFTNSAAEVKQCLEAIGDGNHLHGPILQAFARYCEMTPEVDRDASEIKQMVAERIAMSTRSDKSSFDNDYLDRVWVWADREVATLNTDAVRMKLAAKTIKNWKKKKEARLRK